MLSAYTPAQIRAAYGLTAPAISSLTGKGQTIAIVDAFSSPTVVNDVNKFSSNYTLPTFNNPLGGPTLTLANPSGSTPTGDTGWGVEIALDTEWAHAIAPAANIVLVQAASNSLTDLLAGVDYASQNATVVSMSWGGSEPAGETSLDYHFQTSGVTYVASSGDNGAWYGVSWPATSPNVLSVGGTSLKLNSNNTYRSEVGWSGSGGGYSQQETEPTYQKSVQSSGKRTTPDVAYDASPSPGVSVYDSYGYGGWLAVGGTSAGAPQWAALVALANEARLNANPSAGTLSGASQVLPTLYSLPSSDFHDVTSGYNGYSAKTGYDLVTGLGSPRADQIVPALAQTTTPAALPLSTSSTRTSKPSSTSATHSSTVSNAALNLTAFIGPIQVTAATPVTTAVLFATLPPTPGALVVIPNPVTVPSYIVQAQSLPVTHPLDVHVSIVGGEDPGTGREGLAGRPSVGQPAVLRGNTLPAGMGAGLIYGSDGPAPQSPGGPEEVLEGPALVETAALAQSGQPASALAGLFLMLGGVWAFQPEDSEEERRARAKPERRSNDVERN
jgi:subtilase family serine protease